MSDGITTEAALYRPVKAFLEAQGFEVKGGVCGCDLVAYRADEPPVIVELKLRFNLPLLLQGIDRLRVSERVYLAGPRSPYRSRGLAPERGRVLPRGTSLPFPLPRAVADGPAGAPSVPPARSRADDHRPPCRVG